MHADKPPACGDRRRTGSNTSAGNGGSTVTFLGRQPDEVVNRYASRCQALIFPGEEDFGMAPLEINAAGSLL